MKRIQLTRGLTTIVDDIDYERAKRFKWLAMKKVRKCGTTFYAAREFRTFGERFTVLLHTFILGEPENGYVIDHINGNSLDNRRLNLRYCTIGQNLMNSRKRINCTSKYKGVHWDSNSKKFKAQIQINGKRTHIGLFNKEIDAANAYDKYAEKYYGEYAKTNEQLEIQL